MRDLWGLRDGFDGTRDESAMGSSIDKAKIIVIGDIPDDCKGLDAGADGYLRDFDLLSRIIDPSRVLLSMQSNIGWRSGKRQMMWTRDNSKPHSPFIDISRNTMIDGTIIVLSNECFEMRPNLLQILQNLCFSSINEHDCDFRSVSKLSDWFVFDYGFKRIF